MFKSLIGAGIGGIAGLATGDNYNSTAAFRNFMGGAIAGSLTGGIGIPLAKKALREIPTFTGVKQLSETMKFNANLRAGEKMGRSMGLATYKPGFIGPRELGGMEYKSKLGAIANSPIGKMVGIGGSIATGGLKTTNFLARHPGMSMGAGILGGTAYAFGSAPNTTPGSEDMLGESFNMGSTRSSFQNSASGIVQALHRKRHR